MEACSARSGDGAAGRKEKAMESQWIAAQLKANGFEFVLFPYEQAKVELLDSGPKAAMNSSRVWQEQLMTPAFQIPDTAEIGIDGDGAANRTLFPFVTINESYSVSSFHVMDRFAVTMRPLDEQQFSALSSKREALEDAAARVAGEVFQSAGKFRFEVDKSANSLAYGRQKIPEGKNPAELFPIEMIQWWYSDNEFGFGVQKTTPVIGDRYPSAMGVSPQQVLIWFDIFGMKRYVK